MRRPRSVTLLAVWVFILGMWQWTRAATLLIRRDFLTQLDLSLPLSYAIGSAAVWGGLLAAAFIGLWRLRPWARRLTVGVVTVSQAHLWLDRFLFDRSDYAGLSTGFALATTILTLSFVWGVFWRNRF